MLMTTPKLIFLRIYNAVIGRFNFGKNILRKSLEILLINNKKGAERYAACTKYFNIKNFER